MAPEFEWDPGADGVEPPPSDLLEFWAVGPAIDPAAIWDEVQAGMRAGGMTEAVRRVAAEKISD